MATSYAKANAAISDAKDLLEGSNSISSITLTESDLSISGGVGADIPNSLSTAKLEAKDKLETIKRNMEDCKSQMERIEKEVLEENYHVPIGYVCKHKSSVGGRNNGMVNQVN